ncbi:Uncharacterised protein [Citrobacter freundii]|nr:Uncharacterised protein [Citrobacter freundii]
MGKNQKIKSLLTFLRSRVEPWLTALFQSEHLNILIGAGLSSAIQESATGTKPQGYGMDLKISKFVRLK